MNPSEVPFESPSKILQISGITFLEHSRSSFLGACRSYFVVPYGVSYKSFRFLFPENPQEALCGNPPNSFFGNRLIVFS